MTAMPSSEVMARGVPVGRTGAGHDVVGDMITSAYLGGDPATSEPERVRELTRPESSA